MVKKNILAFFAFFLILMSLNGILAEDVCYIIKTASFLEPDEISLINLLESEGHYVEVLDDDSPIIAGLYDIIIVGGDVSNIEGIFDNKQHKTLFLSPVAAKNAGLAKYSGITSGQRLKITDDVHFITEEFTNTEVTVYDSYRTIGYLYGCAAINSKNLAYKTYDYKSSLLILETDSLLLDETRDCWNREVPTSERNLFFGLPEVTEWKTVTEEFFINSVDWLLHGSDEDGDGFYYDDDCDDSNPNIYPGADEIPYNSIDEDCDGGDLVDYDEDGYDSDLVGGDDCDDDDIEVNPGSLDVYLNCVNDAPIIDPLEKITIEETELLEIEVFALDPEDDSLSYSINDTKFDQIDNLFTWETDYEDMGTYFFIITVSDGELENEIEVEVKVENKNQFPECQEIPDVEWDEDGTNLLDLKDYCTDIDGDSLVFYINETSDADSIILDSFDNGEAVFSSQENWYGEDWIIFKVYDGEDYVLTNQINLIVSNVNDEPEFNGYLEDITWDEDTSLIDFFDLNDYFSDIDSVLNFNVVGNNFIEILIDNGLVSFIPEEDWHDSENVVFEATDGEFTKYANAITLTVIDVSEPPEFEDLNCTTEILEDTDYNCELNATDPEEDEFWFEIIEETNLYCDVDGSQLDYYSHNDYNGEASCKIRVTDGSSYNELVFEVNVLGVNDAPEIKSISPSKDPKIMEDVDFLFEVDANDVDSEIIITWFLDGEEIGSGPEYLFNQKKGDYGVYVEITDGEFNVSHLWNVYVGDISDFTCEEVSGYICEENEMCFQDKLLTVLDSNEITCCSIPCSPGFKEIDRCEILEDNLKLEIKDPDDGDEFEIGDEIIVKIELENDLEDDLDFDIEAYLYDVTEDDEIEEYEDALDVDEDEDEELEFEFIVPNDIEDGNKYSIFVRAFDNDYCTEDYVDIEIDRKKHDLIIKDFELTPKEIDCGDYFYVDLEINNRGTRDEEAYVLIENLELGLKEKTEVFEIEEYDEDDEIKQTIEIKTLENVEEGSYEIKATVVYDNYQTSLSKNILINCKDIEVKAQETKAEVISLIEEGGEEVVVRDKNNKSLAILLIIILVSLFIILGIIAYVFYH